MSNPTTPREVLKHLARILWDEASFAPCDKELQAVIREFNRLAGLDRSLHDARENATDAALFLREMAEVEL